MTQPQYFKAIALSLPTELSAQLHGLPTAHVSAINNLLCLVLGADCPAEASSQLRNEWLPSQQEAARIIERLKQDQKQQGDVSLKRPADNDSGGDVKRARTSDAESQKGASSLHWHQTQGRSHHDAGNEDDPRIFTLHALSITSPIRKKADITIHRSTLRLTQPSDAERELVLLHPPIPLSLLRRAFLLPTRGKARPHWSILILPADAPALAPTTKAGKEAQKAAREAREQGRGKEEASAVVFGIDATPSALETSTYPGNGAGVTRAHARGDPALPSLKQFLSHLPIQTYEPSTSVFRSASGKGGPDGEGEAGVEAYRSAKPGTLWFLTEGVLWDGRPAEFFALSDIAKAGKDGIEGVRTISATGRTCSVILRVREGRETAHPDNDKGKGKARYDDESEEEEDRWEDIDFGMVDGKERESIARWVKRHRHLFGQREEASPGSQNQNHSQADGGNTSTDTGPKATTVQGAAQDDSDDSEDEDFVDDSSSDGGSATSESSSGSSDAEGEAAASASDDENDQAEGNSEAMDEDQEELDPARHPLLRPGAMPRMSRAAVDMVVGMVQSDLMGGAGARPGTKRWKVQLGSDSESEEKDELED